MKIKIYLGINLEECKIEKGSLIGSKKPIVKFNRPIVECVFPETYKHSSKIPLIIEKNIEKAKDSKERTDLIILTHSNSVLNFFSKLVKDRLMDRNDIEVFVLNEKNTYIKHNAFFGEDGYLENYPLGFLIQV